MDPIWVTNANGVSVLRSPTVRIAAYDDVSAGERCVFGGSITNLSSEPVRAAIRPIGPDVPAGTMVGILKGWGEDRGAPIGSAESFFVPQRDATNQAAPSVVRFTLRPTAGPAGDDVGPKPYSDDDVVTRSTSADGVRSTRPARAPRTGDAAHYAIDISGPAGTESWDFRFRTVPGPDIVDVSWFHWLALPLLPLYLVLRLCGAVD